MLEEFGMTSPPESGERAHVVLHLLAQSFVHSRLEDDREENQQFRRD